MCIVCLFHCISELLTIHLIIVFFFFPLVNSVPEGSKKKKKTAVYVSCVR